MNLWIGIVSYDTAAKRYLRDSGHYLQNPPPGCLFAVGVTELGPDLLSDVSVSIGPMRGLCLIGRPVARALPQDGSMGEITRLVLDAGLPHGTASAVLRFAASEAWHRGMASLVSYHDRSRHTGCIYRKAGFRKDGATKPRTSGWGSRDRPASEDAGSTSKRRWRLNRPLQNTTEAA